MIEINIPHDQFPEIYPDYGQNEYTDILQPLIFQYSTDSVIEGDDHHLTDIMI
jgi:hypothetical protein